MRANLINGDEIMFIIDIDHISNQEKGQIFGGDGECLDLLVHKFKIYDDDGELYYEGRSSNQSDEIAFAPLDWAMANDGCTDIKYQDNDTKKWSSL